MCELSGENRRGRARDETREKLEKTEVEGERGDQLSNIEDSRAHSAQSRTHCLIVTAWWLMSFERPMSRALSARMQRLAVCSHCPLSH